MRMILSIILLFSINVLAAENWYADGTASKVVYMNKVDCVAADSGKTNFTDCFDISGLDLRRVMPGLVNSVWEQIPDPAGITAADLEDAQKVTDDTTRFTKKTDRAATAATCVTDINAGGVLSNVQIQSCINTLIKEVFESQIAPSDL